MEGLEKSIKELEDRINKFSSLDEWEFYQKSKDVEEITLDDKNWEIKKQTINWSLNDGDAYFRRWFVVPESIEGIRIEGSKIFLRFVFPSGVTLYVNEKEVYSHKFWADKIATPVLLTEKAKPKDKFLILFKTNKGDGLGFFWAKITIDNLDKKIFQLKSLLYQLKFAEILCEETKNKKLKQNLNDCKNILNPELIEKREWESIEKMIEKIERKLEIFRPYAKKFKVHLIGHAHIDMNWLWTYDDTIFTVLRDFRTITNLMDKYNDLTFSQSQVHVYEIAEKNDKGLFEKVKEKVKKGNWDITANAYVENDLNMSDGESIVRHIIYSKKYVKERFNKEVEIMWSPDTFGHPQTIPTILNNAGIKYYYFMRCGKGYPLFLWEGIDKGRVIAFSSVYNNHIDSDRIIPVFIEYYKRYKIKDFMFVYGVGDHGGGPTEEDIERKIKLNEKPCFPELKFSTTSEFFKKVEKYKNKFPIVKDELNFFSEGCYTTHSDIKKGNRECENLLLKVEALSTIGIINGLKYPEEKIEDMWKKTLFNQFHDIICGSAIHDAYDYSNKLINEVKEDSKKIINEIVEKLKKEKDEVITIFNPSGWQRKGLLKMPFNKNEEIHLEDEKGNKIPVEIKDKNMIFNFEKLPPYNFKNFYIKKGKLNLNGFAKKQEEWEGDYYIIWIDKNTGLIRRIYDKENKKEVMPPAYSVLEDPSSFWAESCANLIKIYWEKPHPMSAWIIGNIYKVENLIDMEKFEIKEGNLETVFEVERKYEDTKILQRTIIYRDFPFIDFEFETNWNIKGNKKIGIPMLRANFNFNFENGELFCEVPFGVVKRKNIPREYPSLRWAGFREGNYWYVIMNKEKYGYYVNGKNLSLTLFRNPYEPDGNPDSGHHFISYRLFFGKSTITEIEKMSIEYNMPVLVFEGEIKGKNLLEIEGNLVPVAFKKSIKGNNFILRLVEYEGKKGRCVVKFNRNVKNIWKSNICEERIQKQNLKNNSFIFDYTPYQIINLLIEF